MFSSVSKCLGGRKGEYTGVLVFFRCRGKPTAGGKAAILDSLQEPFKLCTYFKHLLSPAGLDYSLIN